MVSDLRARARTDILDAAVKGELQLIDVFADYRTDATVSSSAASLDDSDLSPLVDEWNGAGNPKYLAQVRRFIPEGESFPASKFPPRDLPVSCGTH